ncbi:MAG: DUF58 domain-containing protein [Acaryochloris sp. RU_4_1]|nr:DUF58 domain-containing protein [Acaryochloris sp. RU_4_1]NJR56562.1 DUF58 domain-containing protein [Acaryochloris sp. CRU_2_0]
MIKKLTTWLETRWAAPAYAGWVIIGLTLFFLLAAANTLAGWLYVLGGLGLGLLIVAAVLPARSLQGLQIERLPSWPVSVGESLSLGLKLTNPTPTLKSLLQIYDHPPAKLGKVRPGAIAEIPDQGTYTWTYTLIPQQRGIYRWKTVHLRSAAPLGLFWCRRQRLAPAKAIVYPLILPLKQCPLLDHVGQDQARLLQGQPLGSCNQNEGVTRSLRPYRWGDPLRLVHWRTSARYNELRVRELERFTGGQTLMIALDSSDRWPIDDFEQAVIVAASLYTYAQQHQDSVQVWTGQAGLQTSRSAILETLAQVQVGEVTIAPRPLLPMIWLTADPASLSTLPPGSCWLLWSIQGLAGSEAIQSVATKMPGLLMQPEQPLQEQLQQSLSLPTLQD